MVYVCIAEGFEEIEALTPVDVLRRAGCRVRTVGITGKTVTGAHGIPVVCDQEGAEAFPEDLEMLVLPGGMPGARHLDASPVVQGWLAQAVERDRWVAAICAAPSILGRRGLLEGRQATVFPGFEEELAGASLSAQPVVVDGRFVTARGMGVALEFSLCLAGLLQGREKAQQLKESLQCAR